MPIIIVTWVVEFITDQNNTIKNNIANIIDDINLIADISEAIN